MKKRGSSSSGQSGRQKPPSVRQWKPGASMLKNGETSAAQISPAQFASLVERYRSNGTMSALLLQYGQRRNDEAAKNGAVGLGPFDVSSIVTVEKKAGVYDRFAMSALDLISRVDQVDTFGGGVDSPMLQTSIDSFGEPNMLTQQLFDLL